MTFTMRSVSAGYGATTVLRDVSLTVPDGSVVTLLGPNGAGKTTLLRTACGSLCPSKGQIEVDGRSMTGRPVYQYARAGICHVPEGRGLFRTLTVRENLRLQAPRGQEDESIERAATVLPALGRRLDQVAGTLSGGEQQMLALARAYISDPTLVFLDEVSMGLAPKIVDEIFSFLDTLRTSGAALLLVEQYVQRALQIADYVYILNRGTIAFAGQPGELDADDVFRNYVGAET
jgi:branched-chain amino acid transport system ATP-binding protein